MRRDLIWSIWFLAFACTACGFFETDEPACDPQDYAAAVARAYAPVSGKCDDYETIDECPAYQQAKAQVARDRQEFVQCR